MLWWISRIPYGIPKKAIMLGSRKFHLLEGGAVHINIVEG